MEMSDWFERGVNNFMEPIKSAGYDRLHCDEAACSIEGQLRRYMFGASEEHKWDDYGWIFDEQYEETTPTHFHISIKTTIGNDEMTFTFKGEFDSRSSHMVTLKGVQVSNNTFTEYYPYNYKNPLPKPDEIHKDSIALLKPKHLLKVRMRNERPNKSRKLK